MSRSLLFAVGCALVSVVACSDSPIAPAPIGGGGAIAPQMLSMRGVVEQIDDATFGLRRSQLECVPILFDTDALVNLLGREVIVYGNYNGSGAFAVARLELAEDPGDELMRVPALSQGKPARFGAF